MKPSTAGTILSRRPRKVGSSPSPGGAAAVRAWFASKGWTPWPFQEEAWSAYAAGRSGLIQVPTGAGKTYAAYMGAVAELLDELAAGADETVGALPGRLRILYVTPLRAVSRDVELAMKLPILELAGERRALKRVRVESRTGDTSSSVRARQTASLPDVLVTTPESLSLLLTRENAAHMFGGLRCVIIDEWHELIANKRGTQVELGLARLRALAPAVRTWALSATLPNSEEAARAVVGTAEPAPVLIRASMPREVTVRSLLPERVEAFPWAGHLGMAMLPRVLASLDPARSTLIFTNTRSQAELWHQAILYARPQWGPILALHHGSIDRDQREHVEAGVKSGEIRIVVATSSLDLGVDFAPVERVYQIGSPKGVGRIVQRAGRASHRPGAPCEIVCVPTHGLELIEIDAVRRALASGDVEPRRPLKKPLDVLAQHLVTVALGGGFDPDEMYREVTTTHSYRELSRQEFDWALALVSHGGETLRAYPQYRRVVPDAAQRLRVPEKRIATQHRLNVGTIVSEAVMDVRLRSGRRLGTIEESFVSWLKPGQTFLYSGRVLTFLHVRDLTAVVRPAKGKTNFTPRWAGIKLPISESLGRAVRSSLARAAESVDRPAAGEDDASEIRAARPILEAQARLSRIPREGETLVELTRTKEGNHVFVYPFDGRLVHAGMAAVMALRLTRRMPTTFSTSVNDYGFELLTADDLPFAELITPELFSIDGLADDITASMDISEAARRPFREIARVAGLVQANYPGARKSGRQQQVSAGLIFDVFREFDPGNLLLEQARREVIERHFERGRLGEAMRRVAGGRVVVTPTARPTPLGFPLIVERVAALLSGESLAERLRKMVEKWDKGESGGRGA